MTDRTSFQDLPTEPMTFWIGVLLVMTIVAAVVYVATSGPLRARTSCERDGGVYVSRFAQCQFDTTERATPRP